MGYSNWADDFYRDREAHRAATGTSAFVYDTAVAAGKAKREVHAEMNPKGITRESRDSKEHPESVAISVMFDVTGSMNTIPRILQTKLPQLMGLLTSKNFVKDPQVLFGGIGDSRSDQASLQIGQFESGIEMDDDLGKMFLEGGGGGSREESYQNALYFFARHTTIDCFEKRKKRGYLFVIGDEKPYYVVNRAEIKDLCGDTLQADLTIESVISELREKWNVFFIIPSGSSYSHEGWLRDSWTKLLGTENVIVDVNPEGICEAIATVIGLCEGTVKSIDGAKKHLSETGVSATIINQVTAAVAGLAASSGAETPRNLRL